MIRYIFWFETKRYIYWLKLIDIFAVKIHLLVEIIDKNFIILVLKPMIIKAIVLN